MRGSCIPPSPGLGWDTTASLPRCSLLLPASQPAPCREHRSRSWPGALPSGFAADTSHLCPPGHPAPLCGWTPGNIRASAGLGSSRNPEPGGGTSGALGASSPLPCSPLGAPCPGDCGWSLGYVCPLAHSRAGYPAPRRQLSLEFWCGWSWESQPCSQRSSVEAGVWGASPALPGALLDAQFGVPAPLPRSQPLSRERLGLGGSGQGPGLRAGDRSAPASFPGTGTPHLLGAAPPPRRSCPSFCLSVCPSVKRGGRPRPSAL